jgi:uncharacterized membrane protein
MAHCTKCGAVVPDDAAFCGSCGAPQASAGSSPFPPSVPGAAMTQPQMSENVAATLSYALGWVTGLIFYFIDKRPFVRFHAAQSIVVFGALHILIILTTVLFGLGFAAGGFANFSLGLSLYRILDLISLVVWIVLMIKAHQGQRFRVPVAADVAESIFGKA